MVRGRTFEQVYRIVRRIPRGKVMTYGQISLYLENLSAQGVGWAMRCCPEDVPWHRVVNAKGCVSRRGKDRSAEALQRTLLRAEGVRFRAESIDLERYRHRNL